MVPNSFPNILHVLRIPMNCCVLGCMKKLHCTLQNFGVPSGSCAGGDTSGRFRNSADITSLAKVDVTPMERVTGAVDAAELFEGCDRFGHSLFQWPLRPQIRQLLSRIRCCRVFLFVQVGLPFDLPLDPLNLPLLIGQKPRAHTSHSVS